jgi:superfamily I DNA/RNA helicase
LTCFNRNLAAWLEKSCRESTTIRATSFFTLAREFITRAGLKFAAPTDAEKANLFWKEEVPVILCEALDRLNDQDTKRFDCVIVDEAQDFAPDWWLPLQLLLKEPDSGLIQIFSDEEQRGVYGTEDSFPTGLIEMPLNENCRNTRSISEFSSRIVNSSSHAFTLAPRGAPPIIHEPISDARTRATNIKTIFNSLCEQGFDTSQIVILSPYTSKSEKSSTHFLGKIRTLATAGDDKGLQSWQEGKAIWVSTIKAFKGLEADCVILTDVGEHLLETIRRSELYVGCTRAKHILHILPSDETTAKNLKLQLFSSP